MIEYHIISDQPYPSSPDTALVVRISYFDALEIFDWLKETIQSSNEREPPAVETLFETLRSYV